MKKRFILQFWKKTKIYLKKLDSFKVSFLKKEEKSKNRKMKEMIFKKCNFIKLENDSNKFFDTNQFRSVLIKNSSNKLFLSKNGKWNMRDLSFLRYKRKFLKNILTKNAVRLAKISLHLYRNICYIDGTGKKNWIIIKRQYLKKRQFLLQIQFL